MAIRALALDFDGTLTSINTHTEARNEALATFAMQTGDERFIVSPEISAAAHEHGSRPTEIIGWVLQQQGLVKPDVDLSLEPLVRDVVELKTAIYHAKVADGLEANSGALEFIDWGFREYGQARLAIATTASSKEVEPFLRRYELGNVIGTLVTQEDTPQGRSKPDSFAYDLVVKRMGIPAENIAALEDSPRGLQSAMGARLGAAIGITLTHSRPQLEVVGTHTVDSFEALPYLIKNL